MHYSKIVAGSVTGATLLMGGTAMLMVMAQTEEQTEERIRAEQQVFGSRLMTEQERVEYRANLDAAKTIEERERIRAEHHQQMLERAREHGVTLPDEPPSGGGGGMRKDNGMGGGMGRGRP